MTVFVMTLSQLSLFTFTIIVYIAMAVNWKFIVAHVVINMQNVFNVNFSGFNHLIERCYPMKL